MRVISGSARGIALKSPDGMLTRPTADRVKEAMFSILQFDLPGAKVLDLFGGTGQLGIEALSRGAFHADFVDERDVCCKIILENLSKTNFLNQSSVTRSDYTSFLRNCQNRYSIILLDPPYAKDFLENSLKLITEIDILQSGGIIVAEHPVEKSLNADFEGLYRLKDYKYGNSALTLFRKA